MHSVTEASCTDCGAGKDSVKTVVYKLSDYPHPFIHPPLYFLTLTPDLKLSSSYMLYLVVIVCANLIFWQTYVSVHFPF